MLLALAMLACSRPSPAPGAVVVVSDTTRADYGGSDYMPLDLSACRVYTRAHSAASRTVPSTVALVSGRMPLRSEHRGRFEQWPTDEAWPDHVLTDQPVVRMMRGESQREIGGHFHNNRPGSGDLADSVVAEFADGLDGRVYVHMTGPHSPYAGALVDTPQDAPGCARLTAPDRWLCEHRGSNDLPDDLAAWVRLAYLSGAEHTLANVSRIQAAVGPDRLFIFTSDHGEALGEDGLWLHGRGLHDPQIHVPLVVCGPGVVSGEDATPVGPLCVAETVTGRGPCDLRTGEGLRTSPAGQMVGGEWVTRDVGEEWAAVAEGGSAG